MENFNEKVLCFVSYLSDAYKDEEEKESYDMEPLKLKDETLTEDFTAMFYALWALYRNVTGNDDDILTFVGVVNHLVVQKLIEDNGIEL